MDLFLLMVFTCALVIDCYPVTHKNIRPDCFSFQLTCSLYDNYTKLLQWLLSSISFLSNESLQLVRFSSFLTMPCVFIIYCTLKMDSSETSFKDIHAEGVNYTSCPGQLKLRETIELNMRHLLHGSWVTNLELLALKRRSLTENERDESWWESGRNYLYVRFWKFRKIHCTEGLAAK